MLFLESHWMRFQDEVAAYWADEWKVEGKDYQYSRSFPLFQESVQVFIHLFSKFNSFYLHVTLCNQTFNYALLLFRRFHTRKFNKDRRKHARSWENVWTYSSENSLEKTFLFQFISQSEKMTFHWCPGKNSHFRLLGLQPENHGNTHLDMNWQLDNICIQCLELLQSEHDFFFSTGFFFLCDSITFSFPQTLVRWLIQHSNSLK